MAEVKGRVCSINRCVNAATAEESGRIGRWDVTIFYCHEHARELREGTPLGPAGIDGSKVSIDPVGSSTPPSQPGRFPGIA